MDNRYISLAVKLMLLISLLYITVIAVASPSVHPDETVTKHAIDYYKTNFAIPDMRDLPHDVFCSYGQTRLSELTIYYFVAGKIAALIPFENSYRLLNVLLAFIIVFIILKKYKTEPFLIFAFFITPQVWYIFSYATSDALDYFFSFILVYQLTVKTSLLNATLNQSRFNFNKNTILASLFISCLIGLILMAKPNYYIVLLLMAYILLRRYFLADKNTNQRSELMKFYILWAIGSLFIFLLRYSIELIHYGLNKSEIFMQMRIKHAIDMLNPITPYDQMYETMFLAAKNVPFINIFTEYDFLQTLAGSFLGVYGGMDIIANPVYYFVMFAVYICLFTILYSHIIKSKEKVKYIDGAVTIILAVISVCLVMYYSYFIDFQAQGRYLLPILLVITFLVSKSKELMYSNKYFIASILTAGVLSHIYVLTTGLWGIFFYNQMN